MILKRDQDFSQIKSESVSKTFKVTKTKSKELSDLT